jgi:hypothetical protein
MILSLTALSTYLAAVKQAVRTGTILLLIEQMHEHRAEYYG